jgi:hypothetical protein
LREAAKGNFGKLELSASIVGKKYHLQISFNIGHLLSELKKAAVNLVKKIIARKFP